MGFQVTTFCRYRTRRTPPWSDADHAASKFIKALKERPVSGWAYVPVGKEYVRLDAANAGEAADIFARQVACSLDGNDLEESIFIPIPNSSCTLDSSDPPRTLKMVTAMVRRLKTANAIVADVLRWRAVMPPSHMAGGARDAALLFARLRLREPFPTDRRVVLIDDVMATGNHLCAAAAFLESHGATIGRAICAGRADETVAVGSAFALRTTFWVGFDLSWTSYIESRIAPKLAGENVE